MRVAYLNGDTVKLPKGHRLGVGTPYRCPERDHQDKTARIALGDGRIDSKPQNCRTVARTAVDRHSCVGKRGPGRKVPQFGSSRRDKGVSPICAG